MRVYLTVDIEGMAGVVHSEEGAKGNPEYERARRLMTAEASAVVAGIFDADAGSEVLVADVHGPYRNIIPEELDERALLNRGKPKLWGMVDGVADGFDCAMMIGVPQVIGINPTFRSLFSMAPPLANTSVAVLSGKNCDSAASAVEAPSDCRKARRPRSFGNRARITAEATTFS